jgi:hypothetical protein
MRYIKRTGFSYRLKKPDGTLRPRRGLFWMKKVYEEWFEYSKISIYGYPKEFGNLDEFDNFKD